MDELADQVESVADRPQTVSEQEVTSRAPHGASVPARKRVSKGGRSRAAKSGRQEVGEESVAPEDPARPNPQSDDVTEEGEIQSRRKVIKKRMRRAFKDGSAIQFFRNKAGDKGYFPWTFGLERPAEPARDEILLRRFGNCQMANLSFADVTERLLHF